MRIAFLVSKKVSFLTWQSAALRCNDNDDADAEPLGRWPVGEKQFTEYLF